MKVSLYIFGLTFSTLLFSAIPTMDGLFRNANNPVLNGNFVVAKILVEELKSEGGENQKVSEISEEAENEKYDLPQPLKFYGKLIYSLEEEKKIQLLQIAYTDNLMKGESIKKISFVEDLTKKSLEDPFIERNILFSILTMFLTNKTEVISNTLRKIDPKFVTNEEALNKEKVELYKQYRNYLTVLKTDETVKDQITSPMKPETPEELEKVKEILKSSMYTKSEFVSLVKEGDQFYWRLALDNVVAYFSNKKHQIERLEIITQHGSVKVNVDEFILFDGVHELPKKIILKDTMDKVYSIRILSLKNFSNKGKSLSKRHKQYVKSFKLSPTPEAQALASQLTNSYFFY